MEQRRSRHYNWGSADRLLSIEDDHYGLTQYSYSPSGELTMATYADGTKEYSLSDKVGNLYNDPDKKLRKYLEGGRIEKSGEWTFKYDKDGQLIEKFRGKAGFFSAKKDCWEYSWNQNGTLKGVFAPHRHGHWTSFTYDALGRRLTKLGDVTFHYLWNGNVPLHEWQTGNRYVGSVLTPYSEDFKTWLFEEESFVPLALIQDGKAYSIVCDQLGTPTEAYDEEGKEVWYRRLDMNGKILEETQPGLNPEGYVSIPFLFQGQYYDYETGLAYNRFRYYDPELGRYISQDPIRLASGTLAMYGYVEDTSIHFDGFGLEKCYLSAKDKREVLEDFPSEGIKRPHFHHIVRENAPRNWDKEHRGYIIKSQSILKRFKIDLNRNKQNFTVAQNGDGAHTKRAAHHVYKRLKDCKNKKSVVEALNQMAKEMHEGKFYE